MNEALDAIEDAADVAEAAKDEIEDAIDKHKAKKGDSDDKSEWVQILFGRTSG